MMLVVLGIITVLFSIISYFILNNINFKNIREVINMWTIIISIIIIYIIILIFTT